MRKKIERRQKPGANHCGDIKSDHDPDHFYRDNVLVARSYGQKEYIRTVVKNHITICTGPPGCGKTHIACGLAVEAMRRGHIEKIILCRPVGTVEKEIGYLPGDIQSKLDPYLRPLFDELAQYLTFEAIKHFISVKRLEIVPLSAMRGRTFKDSFIVLDEAQNATYNELKMFLTRFGDGSRAVASGDLRQSDLSNSDYGALSTVIDKIHHLDGIGICHLGHDDVVRHRLTSEIDKEL